MSAFREAILSTGLNPPLDIPMGKWVRFAGVGKKDSNKAGWAFMFPDGLGGIFGDHSSDLSEVWQADKVSTYTPEEMVDFKAMVERSRKEAEEQREKEYDKGATKAQNEVRGLKKAKKTHPYLKTKKVAPNGLFMRGEDLVMPLTNSEGAITTYQTISPDGVKKLMYGGKKKGSAYHIKGNGTRTYVVEGFATGATVHEATKANVFVAVDAGNMMPIVENLIDKEYKDIIIAADNDHSSETNTGVTKAKEITKKFQGVSIAYPPPLPDRLSTDWNDYADKKGIGIVATLLRPQGLDGISLQKIMKTKYKPLKWAVPGIIPEGFTLFAGAPKLGKSYGMLGLAYAVATGTKAWGFATTKKASVHYFALEDSERRIQSRVHDMEGYINEIPDNLHIYLDSPKIGEGLMEEFDRLIEQDPDTGLIIVDTLEKISPKSNGKQNQYKADYNDYGGFQKWAIRNGVAVVGVHHTRKGDPDKEHNLFDAISGSRGMQGVPDTLIVCTRPKGKQEGMMYTTGRDVDENDFHIDFIKETMTWEITLTEEEVDTSPVIWDSWFANNDSITIKEACHLWNTNQHTARKKLEALVDSGEYAKEEMPHEGRGRPQNKYYPIDKKPITEDKSETSPWG